MSLELAEQEIKSYLKVTIKKRGKLDYIKDKSFCSFGTSLVVQWLRLQALSAGGPGLIPSQETSKQIKLVNPNG